MSCRNRNIKLRHILQDVSLSHRYVIPGAFVIIPVFCVCMISVMGSFVGLRHAVTMQFDVDADTEYIAVFNADYVHVQHTGSKQKVF